MRQLMQDMGIDDRYIALMPDALSREYSVKQPSSDGFGSRYYPIGSVIKLLLSTGGTASAFTNETTLARPQPCAWSERCV